MANKYTDYFGFDLGDGESAVAWLRAGSLTDPKLIEIRGRKSVLSVLGEHPERGMLIGDEAYQASDLTDLRVRFKQGYLAKPEQSGECISKFARVIYDTLRADGRMLDEDSTCFFVGCPSGWSDEVREEYKKLFENAGMKHVQIVSESRAAFMYARESGELAVSEDMLTLPTLILDAGSSTTDFTFVADLAERSLDTSDFGESALGGGILDQLLLEMNLKRSPRCQEIEGFFRRFPSYKARAELEARKVKEMYFTQLARGESPMAESSVKIYAGDGPVTLDITASVRDMQQLLARPLDSLSGLSFEGAYLESLQRAREQLSDCPPQVILLTGGASRMGFLAEQCRQVFPNAQILRGLEPEYAIARGLCHALRVDQKTKGFAEAVTTLAQSSEMETLVMQGLPALFECITPPLVEKMTQQVALRCYNAWQQGDIRTIGDIGKQMALEMTGVVQDPEFKEVLTPAITKWLSDLHPEMEKLTDPICDQYGLPRASLRLPSALDITASGVTIPTSKLLDNNQLKVLIDLIVALIMAILLGGGGIALLMSGPIGTVVGLIAGLAVAILGTNAVEKVLYSMDLPVSMRRMMFPSPKKFLASLLKRRAKIEADVCDQMKKGLNPPGEEITRMVSSISQSIEQQLLTMMQRATLRIH